MERIKRALWGLGALLMIALVSDWGAVKSAASGITQQAYNLVQNGGSPLTRRTTINCTGSLTCSDAGGVTVFNASGGAGGTAGSPLFVQTSSVTVTSNMESTLIGSGVGSLTIPANWFSAGGTVMEVCASGTVTTAAAAQGTVNFKLKFGSTVIAQTGAFTPTANLSTDAYDFCIRLTARTVGAMGTIMASNMLHSVGTTLVTPMGANFTNPTPGTAVTVDTTATQALDLTVTWSANATNSITQTNFYMVGPGSAVSSVQGLTGAVTVTDANLSTSDVTTNNCSTSKHGFAPKAPNDATKFLDGTCNYSTPAGGGGAPGGSNSEYQYRLNSTTFGAVTNSGPVPTASWTIRNGAVFNNFSGAGMGVIIQNNPSVNFRFVTQPLSARPYTVIATLDCRFLTPQNNAQACGVYLFDGTQLESIELLQNNGLPGINVRFSTAVTSGGSTLAGPTSWLTPLSAFTVKIVDNSTNRTFFYYTNGGFTQFFQEASAANLTPTSVGVGGVDTSGGSPTIGMNLVYWCVANATSC